MYEAIKQLAQKYHQETINQRRDFHHFAERGWLEIRTACQIATTLENLGYEVLVGKEIMDKDARMGLPPEAIFNINYLRAKKEGANPKYLEQVKNGMTAVAGILKNGVGPVVAIRFDIDAIHQAGYTTETPVIVTNQNDYQPDVVGSLPREIERGEVLLTASKI